MSAATDRPTDYDPKGTDMSKRLTLTIDVESVGIAEIIAYALEQEGHACDVDGLAGTAAALWAASAQVDEQVRQYVFEQVQA